jgi:hypothetical protein
VFSLDFEVRIKKIASPKIRPTTEIPTYGYNKSPSKHPKKTPPTWLPLPRIATTYHCPLWLRHAETTVKGTEMGYRNFSPAEIGHCQPPQKANIDKTQRRRFVPLQS